MEAIDYPGLERQRLGVGDASGGRVSVALPRKVPKCPFTGRRALEPAGVTCAVPSEQPLAAMRLPYRCMSIQLSHVYS